MGTKLLIQRQDESTYEAHAVITFNEGYSHFIEDDGCYLLVNGHPAPKTSRVSKWIFPEAVDVLMLLRTQELINQRNESKKIAKKRNIEQ